MAKPFDVEKSSDQLMDAAKHNDGISAARILDEVGACNWKELVDRTNAKANGSGFHLSTFDEVFNFNSEKMSLYKYGDKDDKVIPLAAVTQTRCGIVPKANYGP